MQVAERLYHLLAICEDAAQQIEKGWRDIDQILFDLRRTASGICDVSGGNEKARTDRGCHRSAGVVCH
jgi:hypothetical protein